MISNVKKGTTCRGTPQTNSYQDSEILNEDICFVILVSLIVIMSKLVLVQLNVC